MKLLFSVTALVITIIVAICVSPLLAIYPAGFLLMCRVYPSSKGKSTLAQLEERSRQMEIEVGLRYDEVSLDQFIQETEQKLHPQNFRRIKCHPYGWLEEGARSDCNHLMWVERSGTWYGGDIPQFKGVCPKCSKHRTYFLTEKLESKIAKYQEAA